MQENSPYSNTNDQEYLTISLQEALFGIPVKKIKDVFYSQEIQPVPLSSPDILGVMNLRGNIVTAIDLRKRLEISDAQNQPIAETKSVKVVVELGDELYSLNVDGVGSVIALAPERIESAPSILESRWRAVTSGVYKLQEQLLIILDLDKLLRAAEIS